MKNPRNQLSIICRIATAGCVAILVSFSTGSSTSAQERFEFEMKMLRGIPTGSFADQIGQTMWGASFSGAYHFRESPWSVGMQVGGVRYGAESTTDIPGHPTGPSAGTRYAYKMFLSHLSVRYQPSRHKIVPYLEVLIGYKFLLTEKFLGTSSSVPFFTGDMFYMIDSEDTETVLSRAAPSFGLGSGLKLQLAEFGRKRRGNRGPASLYLSLQGRYLFGSRADYLRVGAITFEDGQRQLDITRSRTDMFHFNIGLAIQG